MIINIKTGPVATLSNEELIEAVALLGILADRVTENGHQVPDRISESLRDCEAQLDARLAADRERELARLKAQRETLLTRKDRLSSVDNRIAELEKSLGKQAPAQEKTA